MTNSELKSKLEKSLNFLKSELNQIRTGRASPAILDDVKVDAYDSLMSVRELASITLIDSTNLVVSPWDKNLSSAIAKAIRDSDLNLNPVEEPDKIRIPIPSLTEERRVEFAKQATQKVEDSKTSMRNIRQEAMKDIDLDFSNKSISEDEKFDTKEDVEDTVKSFVEQAEELGASKKEEILKV